MQSGVYCQRHFQNQRQRNSGSSLVSGWRFNLATLDVRFFWRPSAAIFIFTAEKRDGE